MKCYIKDEKIVEIGNDVKIIKKDKREYIELDMRMISVYPDKKSAIMVLWMREQERDRFLWHGGWGD